MFARCSLFVRCSLLRCFVASLFRCFAASLPRYFAVSLPRCLAASLLRRRFVRCFGSNTVWWLLIIGEVFARCSLFVRCSLLRCFAVSLFRCLAASLPRCFAASLPRCLAASLPRCLAASLLRPTLTLSFTTASVLPTGPCATAEVIFGGRRLQCRRLHGLTYRGTVVISAHIHLTTQLEPLLLNLSKPTHRGLPDHFVLC